MSVESIGRALNVDDSRLATSERFVLVCMANHDGDGGCWPAISTLARYTGLTERSVQRAIGRLEALGYVIRHLREGGTQRTDPRYRPNRYTLRLSQDNRGDTVSPLTDPAVTLTTSSGDIDDSSGVTPTSPEPSLEPSIEPSSAGVAKADAAAARALPPAAAAALEIFVAHRVLTKQPDSPKRYATTVRRTEYCARRDDLIAAAARSRDSDPVAIAVEVFAITLDQALRADHHRTTTGAA